MFGAEWIARNLITAAKARRYKFMRYISHAKRIFRVRQSDGRRVRKRPSSLGTFDSFRECRSRKCGFLSQRQIGMCRRRSRALPQTPFLLRPRCLTRAATQRRISNASKRNAFGRGLVLKCGSEHRWNRVHLFFTLYSAVFIISSPRFSTQRVAAAGSRNRRKCR